MNTHPLRNVVVAVLGLVVICAVWAGVQATRPTPAAEAPAVVTTSTDAQPISSAPVPAANPTLKVALLDYAHETPGKERGCDRVILVDRPVATTTAPLTTALRELFAIKETEIGGLGNFIPRTRQTLSFDKAAVEDGTARIYLNGSLSGLAGVCDDPRAKIQIEETALQFPTVQRVELYLNGTRTKLQPSQQ